MQNIKLMFVGETSFEEAILSMILELGIQPETQAGNLLSAILQCDGLLELTFGRLNRSYARRQALANNKSIKQVDLFKSLMSNTISEWLAMPALNSVLIWVPQPSQVDQGDFIYPLERQAAWVSDVLKAVLCDVIFKRCVEAVVLQEFAQPIAA